MAFSLVRAIAKCVMLAIGSVSTATLRQPSTSGGCDTVKFKVWTLSYCYCVNLVHMKFLLNADIYGIWSCVNYLTIAVV